MQIAKPFDEVQLYADSVEVQAASDAVRRAQRTLFDSFHEPGKRKKMQTFIVEFFKAP